VVYLVVLGPPLTNPDEIYTCHYLQEGEGSISKVALEQTIITPEVSFDGDTRW